MMDIGKDLQNAYKEGYKQGYEQGKKEALDYEKSMREEAIYHEAYSEERGMTIKLTREEAIQDLEAIKSFERYARGRLALDMAIEALKREDTMLKEIERVVLYGERSEGE